MKQNITNFLQKISLLILLFIATAYTSVAQYTLTDDDVVVINGIVGNCSYSFDSTNIIIPGTLDGQKVVGIGSEVFQRKGITSVDLSACTALSSIGYWAFSDNNLVSLDLGACISLTSIDIFAFCRNSLTQIILPNSITHIGTAAFNSNKIISVNGIQSKGIIYARNADTSTDSTVIVSYGGASNNITVPSKVVTIGYSAFSYTSLNSLDLSACTALSSIESWAFHNNSLTSLDLSACTALSSIGSLAFFNNSLTSIDLRACISLTDIGEKAFASNKLTSLDLSDCTSLSYIGFDAFENNSLSNLDLSTCTALTYIGMYAFHNNSLTSIDLSSCISLTYIGSKAFYSNDFSKFTLPTPNIKSHKFKDWEDDNRNKYAGGALVDDLETGYTANLSKTD